MTCRKCNHETVKKFGRHGRLRIQRYRCTTCSATFSDTQTRPLGTMRIPEAEALQALRCLLEGCSIRSTERLTGLHRDTIMSLLVLAGERCAKVMDSKMHGLTCRYIQCDETSRQLPPLPARPATRCWDTAQILSLTYAFISWYQANANSQWQSASSNWPRPNQNRPAQADHGKDL
jgi:transposase-like protein